MAYPAKSIANELLTLAKDRGIGDITPMKLQKLVYYAHGWWYGVTGEPLIEEQIEAWQYGPVVPSLYEATKKFGNQTITAPLHDYALENDELVEVTNHVEGSVTTHANKDAVLSLLDWVLEEYGDKSGVALSNLSHIEGGPWDITVQKHQGKLPKSTDIAPQLIEDYFKAEASKLPVFS